MGEVGGLVEGPGDGVEVVGGGNGDVFAGTPRELELDVPAAEGSWEAVGTEGAVGAVVSVGDGDEGEG